MTVALSTEIINRSATLDVKNWIDRHFGIIPGRVIFRPTLIADSVFAELRDENNFPQMYFTKPVHYREAFKAAVEADVQKMERKSSRYEQWQKEFYGKKK